MTHKLIPDRCSLCNKELEPISPEEQQRAQDEAAQSTGLPIKSAFRFCRDCGPRVFNLPDDELTALLGVKHGEELRRPHLHCEICGACVALPSEALRAELLLKLGREWDASRDAVVCDRCGPRVEAYVKAVKN